MPVITAAIDPITRIEGHLKVEVDIDTVDGAQQVVDARATGTLFRGFELVLANRDPRDAPNITSRICGVCPISHSMAAAVTLDQAFGLTQPEPSRLLRNLVHGAGFLESHILHFYVLSLPDFIHTLGMAPWAPDWVHDLRVDPATAAAFRDHYPLAIDMRRKVHEMGAIFAGRLPHTPAYIAGGFTAVPNGQDKQQFQAYLDELIPFIEEVYLPDVERLAALYDDYFEIGGGHGHLLSFGVFDQDATGASKLIAAGRTEAGSAAVLDVDLAAISEHVTHSWYEDRTHDLHPAVGETAPQHPKAGAYSWLKAPRYAGLPYEVGPLARMRMQGEYTHGVSVMDRHRARARETLIVARAMVDWLAALPVSTSAYTPAPVPDVGEGVGLTEAPRGALGHWLSIREGVIAHYQVLTPTCWNVSPRDGNGVRGPLEEALVGTPVRNADQPIEALRVVHSYDPCLDCATHVMRPDGSVRVCRRGPAQTASLHAGGGSGR